MGQTPSYPRIAWIDNLRTLLIVLVVNMHACVTYSHVGSWYRMENPEPALPAKMAFILWQGHLQAFFMGLLFFLAGVFAHPSLERRGPGAFLHERARRLGLPSLLFMLLVHPFMVYVLL
ncbi:MAG TPA: acyltransferase family protein, partial [Verrucomicrobiae bacterium]|nr:acyltransferase family protein [Verrucomicrobiae bacterium]